MHAARQKTFSALSHHLVPAIRPALQPDGHELPLGTGQTEEFQLSPRKFSAVASRATNPALRSGNPTQEASTHPPTRYQLGGALKIHQGPWRLPAWQNLNYGHHSHLSDDVKRLLDNIVGVWAVFPGTTGGCTAFHGCAGHES